MKKSTFDKLQGIVKQTIREGFDKRFVDSLDKKNLVQREIKTIEKYFCNEEMPVIIAEDRINDWVDLGNWISDKNTYDGVRENYHRYILYGEQYDYSELPEDADKAKDSNFNYYLGALGFFELLKHLRKLESTFKTGIEIPVKDGLEEIMYPDYVLQFGEIEKELIRREYLNEQYQWQYNKKTFCEFLVVILSFKYTKSSVTDTKVRYFFENRYGKPKKFLSAMFKRSKRPQFDIAKIPFSFISGPEKSR